MIQLADRIAKLSPEKRALLTRKLRQRQSQDTKADALRRRERSPNNPLSFAQQRLWFLDQFEPGTPYYNIPAAVRLIGPLNVNALKRSLNEIVRRHEVLRVSFKVVDDEPVQTIAPDLQLEFPVDDMRHLLADERASIVRDIAREEACRSFDLSRGPLLRARLLKVDVNEHVLLLTFHHIVYDGWSTGVLVRELSHLYRAFSQNLTSPLPDLPLQYIDYAQWQRERLTGDLLERQLAYWRAVLEGAPAVLGLPTDHPRPPVQTYLGAHTNFELPRSLVQELKALCRQESVTPFMALLAMFQTLLHRYTGENDICVGTPVANRTRAKVEPLIGCFINTLVIRADITGNPTFRELLSRVRRRTLEAQDHQELPFEVLAETLQPQREMSHSPLFQVMFDLQELPLKSLRLDDLELSLLEIESGVAKFDLSLTLLDDGVKMVGGFEYNTDLFEATTIERMAGHFVNLVRACLASPDRPVGLLPILSAEERYQLLNEWNATETDYPQDVAFHRTFEAQVELTPAATAVVHRDDALSYEVLNRRANQVARYLQQLGVGPEALVGLAVERSPALLVGLVGILKAGGAYLPLDPAYPQERLAFMLEDSGARLLLTQSNLLSDLPNVDIPVVCLDRDWESIAGEEGDNLDVAIDPTNVAYVIYTSGSTGRPKGVMIQHRSMLHLATALHQFIYESRLTGPLRVSLNAPVSFDASVQQIVMLRYGHALYIIPEEARQDGAALVDYVRRHRLHLVDCVPTQLKLLLDAGFLNPKAWVPQAVLPGGEAIDEPTWERLKAAPATEFYNMYGPTECTVDSTVGWVRIGPDQPSIGRPLPNVRLYILDTYLQPVPIGVAGELYIGGAGVGRGYLHRPALTAERFIPDPFSDQPGTRLYRTGDLARYLPDGNVEFLGRVDHQVKVRGFRIELGEIEAVLKSHKAVRESVVLAREDVPGDKRLVAYCVPEQIVVPKVDELQHFLKEQLPEYMVPSAFVMLDALPLTPNGKVNRRALPAPELSRPELSTAYVPPKTELEHSLSRIWQTVLRVQHVGVQDNFFALGGDSIRAAIVTNAIKQSLDEDVPVKAIFLAPTITELAVYLQEHYPPAQRRLASADGETLSERRIPRVSRDGELLLSSAQQRLWFLEQLEPGSPLYTIAGGLRISGPLDVNLLRQCFNEIVRRHEVLRTAFHTMDGTARLTILPELPLSMPVVDLTDLTEAERDAEVHRLSGETARWPFRLDQPPLLRVKLLRTDDEEHIALLAMHHIISDGWSMGVLSQELAALYEAFSREQPTPLPPLPVQYVDYAHWQRDWMAGKAFDSQVAYWTDQLRGSPPLLTLPLDHPRPAEQSTRGSLHFSMMPAELTRALRDLGQQLDATLFMTLLAGFQLLLSRYSGQDDILVGTPVANRNHTEIEGLIGFFVNTLVIRTDLSASLTFRDLLQQVRDTTLGAYEHADLPFDRLVDALQVERNLSYAPLFQVMFAFDNASQQELALPGLTLTPLEIDTGTSKFDLALSISERDGRLRIAMEYNTDLFETETVARMARHYGELLRNIVADPDRPVFRLSVLTEAERYRTLVQWNATTVTYPQICAHRLFERQVEQTPDAVALVFEDQQLTYRELNRRANQVAHRLQAVGVAPEQLVGLYVERSLDMIVAIFGVLKAGGAYVPLDPGYPQDRISFMIEDSQLSVLLIQPHLKDHLPPSSVPIICLGDEDDVPASSPEENPETGVGPDHLAYVIYTSGSTGKPKGVLVEHRNLCNTALTYIRGFGVGPGTRVLQFFSFSFDGSVADIFMSLLSGATLCLVPQDLTLPGPGLSDLLRRQEISLAVLTPSALSALPVEEHPQLQTLLTGGEACTLELVKRWARGRRFFNVYGPTEGTVAASWYEVLDPDAEGSNISIGRPMANARLYILDRHLQPVAVGVTGELYIGGAGVARGYLNRPDLTLERFVADPFHDVPGARMYKTGDLARYRSDGNIDFLGRIDGQVKIRGFRIELGEIEAQLRDHSALEDAVVLAREDTPGNKRLVAYVVPREHPGPTIGGLREFLAARLPAYMVPALYVSLEKVPLTSVGKVDHRALPAPDQDRPDLGHAYVAPRSHDEATLADIWSEVLGVEQVGIYDDFFELGGDSILSIQVVARANQAGLHLSPRQLFQAPTVGALAAVAEKAPVLHAEQGTVIGNVPLTPIQHWFFEQAFVDPHYWNQAFLLEVREQLQTPAFERALAAVLGHHDALRMRYIRTTEGWQQINADLDDVLPFERIDLSSLSPSGQAAALEARIAETQSSLNLTTGPLIRAVYFDMGSQLPGRLLIVVHHLVIDGVSWRILVEDLLLGYQQCLQGHEIALPSKTTSFKYWATRLSEYAQSEEALSEVDYWSSAARTWSDAYEHSLGLDLAGGQNDEATAESVVVNLGREQTQHLLHDAHAAYGTEINDVLLTALVESLVTVIGRRALLVDLEGHGREDLFPDVDISRTVGWFTTAFPVYLDLRQIHETGSALKAIKEQLRAVPRKGIGYGLLRYLNPGESSAWGLDGPLPQISFNYLGQFDQALASADLVGLADESVGRSRSPKGLRSHVMDVTGAVVGGQLQVEWTYSTSLHHRSTVVGLAEAYMEALRDIIAHCLLPETVGYTPSDFPDADLSEDELDALISEIEI